MKYVYEFTNKRKLTKTEFIRWFEKKFLYINRKFNMVNNEDVVLFEDKNDFRDVVLKHLLEIFAEKTPIKLVKSGRHTKKAVSDTLDSESDKIIHIIIKGKAKKLDDVSPVKGKIVKPLYLFLDKEVKLYADLIGLKYKETKEVEKDNISKFLEDIEKKHPELKHSIVNSYLELM